MVTLILELVGIYMLIRAWDDWASRYREDEDRTGQNRWKAVLLDFLIGD